MAEKIDVVDGLLKITVTPDEITTTMTPKEVEGKIAEIQTKIDHLEIDLAAAEREKAEWQSKLEVVKK